MRRCMWKRAPLPSSSDRALLMHSRRLSILRDKNLVDLQGSRDNCEDLFIGVNENAELPSMRLKRGPKGDRTQLDGPRNGGLDTVFAERYVETPIRH